MSLIYTQPPKAATLQPFRLKVEREFDRNTSSFLAMLLLKSENLQRFGSRNEKT